MVAGANQAQDGKPSSLLTVANPELLGCSPRWTAFLTPRRIRALAVQAVLPQLPRAQKRCPNKRPIAQTGHLRPTVKWLGAWLLRLVAALVTELNRDDVAQSLIIIRLRLSRFEIGGIVQKSDDFLLQTVD